MLPRGAAKKKKKKQKSKKKKKKKTLNKKTLPVRAAGRGTCSGVQSKIGAPVFGQVARLRLLKCSLRFAIA